MKSVGDILLSTRKKAGITIDDVHRAVKIHPKYIKALEKDDYSIFDGKVHAKGFLKVYTEYLELNLEEIMALWRREYAPSLETKDPEKFSKLRTLEPEKFIITPGVVIITAVVTLLLGFFTFLFFQYRDYTDSPSIDIFHPEDNFATSQDILDITGRVELDSEVFINNQKIIANPDGSFLTSVKLREGINTISIKAINKLNKETEVLRSIIYRSNEPEPEPEIVQDETSDLLKKVETIEEAEIVEESAEDE